MEPLRTDQVMIVFQVTLAESQQQAPRASVLQRLKDCVKCVPWRLLTVPYSLHDLFEAQQLCNFLAASSK
jgi:hypothetical protein